MIIKKISLVDAELRVSSVECQLPQIATAFKDWPLEENEVVDIPKLRMILLADNSNEILLIAADLSNIKEYAALEVQELISQNTGINEATIFLASTHCHSTYHYHNFDSKLLAETISSQVSYLRNNLKKTTTMAIREYTLPDGVLVNRRFDFPNKEYGSYSVVFNDDTKHENNKLEVTNQVEKYLDKIGATATETGLQEKNYLLREVDKRLHMVSFLDHHSKEIASICRVNAHPVITSYARVGKYLSADYPAYMNEKLSKHISGTILIWNGALGDVRPLNREYSHAEAKRFGYSLAKSILSVKPDISDVHDLGIRYARREIPFANTIPHNLDELKNKIAKVKDELKYEKISVKKKKLQECLCLLGSIDKSITDKYYPESYLERGTFQYEMSLLKLNSINFCGISGEPFVGFAKQLEKITGALTIGCVGTYASYLLPPEEYKNGGYEASVAIADESFLNTILELAKEICSTPA